MELLSSVEKVSRSIMKTERLLHHYNFKWCQAKMVHAPFCRFWQWADLLEPHALYSVFLLSVWLSAALSWHLDVIHQRTLDVCLSLLVSVTQCACQNAHVCVCVCLLAVTWSSECAFSSTAPLSSSGSSRRMLGNTPVLQATAWANHRLPLPT